MGTERRYTTNSYIVTGQSALTGGCGFDQCPAPFAGPAHPQPLRIAPATPD